MGKENATLESQVQNCGSRLPLQPVFTPPLSQICETGQLCLSGMSDQALMACPPLRGRKQTMHTPSLLSDSSPSVTLHLRHFYYMDCVFSLWRQQRESPEDPIPKVPGVSFFTLLLRITKLWRL